MSGRLLGLGTVLVAAAFVASDARGQADSTSENLRPQRAARRALVPGLGQFYNRQYVKIPVVYIGFAGFAAAALHTNGRYLRYRHAYLYTARQSEGGDPVFPEYVADYAALLRDLGLRPESELSAEEIAARRARLEPQFRAQRDNMRRNRDLLYFGIIGWYGLSILDAFVSAHLSDFEVGEDLTVRFGVHPQASGLSATVVWGL